MQILPGDLFWADFGDGRGRERSGIRPAVVISSVGYLRSVDALVHVVPVTTTDRGWPNHIVLSGLTGLGSPSWGMTEQVRVISRERLLRGSGTVDDATFDAIRLYLRDALDL